MSSSCGPAFFGNSAVDPFFSSVGLLLHFDGANGSSTFVDNSPHPHTMYTPSCLVDTSTSVFGGASAKTTVTSSYINCPADATYITASGSSAWTIEFRFYTTSLSAAQVLFDTNTINTNNTGWQVYVGTNGLINIYSGAQSTGYGNVGTSCGLNTWNAYRISWDGTTLYFLQNGALIGTSTGFTNVWGSGVYIMNSAFANQRVVGNMDEFRFTKAVCRSTATYTLDSAAFPNQ